MSTPRYTVVTHTLLAATTAQAKESPRGRQNHNLHQLEDRVQRMLNAIEPGSYVRPHRHIAPPKCEHFVLLQGKLAVLVFDNDGSMRDVVVLSHATEQLAIDLKPGVWHSVMALESGSVVVEIKDGPYDPATDKDWPHWAPPEESDEATAYRAMLESQVQDWIAS